MLLFKKQRSQNPRKKKGKPMDPVALHYVPKEVQDLFWTIIKIFEHMPQEKVVLRKSGSGFNVLISCHVLCRALEYFFPVSCRDGYFGKIQSHSWLLPKARWSVLSYFYDKYIIDVYPCAVASGPMLVMKERHTAWYRLYEEDDLPFLRQDKDYICPDDVFAVAQMIEEITKRLKIKMLSNLQLRTYVSIRQIKQLYDREPAEGGAHER